VDYFKRNDFVECAPEETEFESGFEKIALYGVGNSPVHLARQLSGGKWASKCGQWEDIVHDLADVEGPYYGTVVRIFKKANTL